MTKMADRKDLTKSAPANGRRQSNSEVKKNSTIKEINNWINKGNNGQLKRSGARHVSQLTENVTEERMLYARQLELGRERYKFLVSHEYEKQRFVERQTTKDKMMKKYMSSARKVIDKACTDKPKKVLTVRMPQVEFVSQSSTPVNEDQSERLESRLSRASARSVKQGEAAIPRIESRAGSRFMNHGESESKGRKEKSLRAQREQKPVVQTLKVPKEITFVDYSRPDSRALRESNECSKSQRPDISGNSVYVNTSLNTNKNAEEQKTVEKDSRLPSVSTPCGRRVFGQERNVSGLSARSRSTVSLKQSKQTTDKSVCNKLILPETSASEPVTPKWHQKRELKFGEKFGSSITDPRYVALEETLIPADLPIQPSTDVKDIIARNRVLRTSSKCESAAHAKLMHAKFIALILEKELAA